MMLLMTSLVSILVHDPAHAHSTESDEAQLVIAASIDADIAGAALQPPRRDGRRGGRRGGPPPTRYHTDIESGGAILSPATQAPIAVSLISIESDERWQFISANGISEHDTGRFPGSGNPNTITVQDYSYRLPVDPIRADRVTQRSLGAFGIGVNGVLFDPSAAEWYHGVRGSPWQYEALAGAVGLSLDANYAHVQPNGIYHYHGLPTGLLDGLELSADTHSPLVGWAFDGFPIYALFGADETGDTVRMRSSYRLKAGTRPVGDDEPGGVYDGTFTADYEYVAGLGDLDACNAAFVATPEFPDGTWAYFLTETFPVVPRCFIGDPVVSGPAGPRGRIRRG
jgi:hypothetical protein